MLLRNATILLAFLLGLAQTIYAQTFYYSPEGKTYLEVSTEKILIQFHPSLSSNDQNQILAPQSDFLNLSTKVNLPAPQISVVELENISNENDVKILLENIKSNESIAYTSYFLNHPDSSQHGVTNKVLARLIDDSQIPTINFIYTEFEGILSYAQNAFDPLLFEIEVDKDHDALKVANKMHESGFFEFAEPDFLKILKKFNTNDPQVDTQWALNNNGQNTAQYGGVVGADMNVFNAWNFSTGASNIKVAIIDEGVDLNHPDLAANLLPGYDATGQGSAGAPSGDDAHGTACAGIVAAVGNNNIGGAGVAYNCKIIPIRIGYGSGGSWVTNSSWIANGMNWAWQNGNADVLSNSWGGGGASFVINNAIDGALSNGRGGLGSPVVFAAGNNNSAVSYPAAYAPTIAVVAMSMCNERKNPGSCDGEYWWGSNYGTGADVAAPGVKIFTTDISGGNGYSSGDYTTSFNGTSSACPNAAGVMALILSHNNTLTATDARVALESSTDKVGGYAYSNVAGQPNGTWSAQLGYGRIDAAAALGGGVPPALTNDAGILAINSPVGLYCYNSVSSQVILKNYGTNALTSVMINYSLNGGASFVYNWTGALASSATTSVSLPSIGLTSGNHTLQVATSNPNFQADADPSNDAQTSTFSVGENNLTLTLVFDANAAETSWEIKNAIGTVVYSGNNYGNYPIGGIHSEDICLENGCYELTVFDTGGNGMCCTQGNGAYQLKDNNSGSIISSGGQFSNFETSNFCLPSNYLPLSLSILGGNNVTCNGGANGSASVAANGGSGNYSFSWSNGATGPTASNLQAGNYQVTVFDGITSVATTIIISEPDAILIDITSTNSNGNNSGSATATVTGGIPDYSYLWSNGEITPAIQNLPGGMYTLTVTDQVGCTATETTLISDFTNANLWVEVLSMNAISCYGESDGQIIVQGNGGNGNYTYTWSNGATGSTISNLVAGNYTVTATDGTLSGIAAIVMMEPQELVIQTTHTNVDHTQNGTATAIPQGGTPDYFYQWSTGATTATIVDLSPGIYSVTVTDAHDCTAIAEVEIVDDSPEYCESSGNDSSREWIEYVKFNTINNFSGNNDGYANFTNQITEVERGSQHSITLAPGFAAAEYEENWVVWIDYNHDYDFDDADERVFFSAPSVDVVLGNITIPDDALPGMTRMRISMKWKESPTACETFDFGEVEDYSIFILPSSGNNPCSEVKVNAANFEDNWGIWMDGGEDCRRSIEDHPYAKSGKFCIRLRDHSESSLMTTENLNLNDFENITVKFSFITKSMEAVTDNFKLQISRDGGQSFETIQTWTNGIDFLDGQRRNETVSIDGDFSDMTRLRFRCDAEDDQDWVFIDDVDISGCKSLSDDSIITSPPPPSPTASTASNVVFDFVKIFPNPTNELLNVTFFTTQEMNAQVSVTNMVGKIIFSQDIFLENDKHQLSINVSNFDAGIYFINIFGKDEKVIEKFVVENN